MNVKKKYVYFLKIVLLLIFCNPTNQLKKCDQRLMNSFMLTGMPYSVYSKMKVCGNVHDKCCTIADEIKISKLWNFRVAPILDSYNDEHMSYLRKIMLNYYDLMNIDPRLIVMKYVQVKVIPFEDHICSGQEKVEKPEDEKQFLLYNDGKLQHALQEANPEAKINTQDVTHYTEKEGHPKVRHWDVKAKEYYGMREQYAQYTMEPTDFKEAEIEYNDITCNVKTNHYTHEFVIVNEIKANFCLDLYHKFLNFNNRQFMRFLPTLKSNQAEIHKIKGTFYCSLCDSHQQKFFDPASYKIAVETGFCKALLSEKKEFFLFINVLLIEYLDLVLQYVNCFETPGENLNFPAQNFLVKYKRRIPFIKKCFDNLEADDVMKYCWFICNKYEFLKISPFFDGNLEMMKRVYLVIYSFLRKMEMSKVYEETRLPSYYDLGPINGLLIEPINASHFMTKRYYADDEMRKDILGSLDTRQNNIPSKEFKKNLDQNLKALGLKSLKNVKDDFILKKKLLIEEMKLKKQIRIRKELLELGPLEKKKYLKKMRIGINPISQMKDHLYNVKTTKSLHTGYYPIRKLNNYSQFNHGHQGNHGQNPQGNRSQQGNHQNQQGNHGQQGNHQNQQGNYGQNQQGNYGQQGNHQNQQGNGSQNQQGNHGQNQQGNHGQNQQGNHGQNQQGNHGQQGNRSQNQQGNRSQNQQGNRSQQGNQGQLEREQEKREREQEKSKDIDNNEDKLEDEDNNNNEQFRQDDEYDEDRDPNEEDSFDEKDTGDQNENENEFGGRRRRKRKIRFRRPYNEYVDGPINRMRGSRGAIKYSKELLKLQKLHLKLQRTHRLRLQILEKIKKDLEEKERIRKEGQTAEPREKGEEHIQIETQSEIFLKNQKPLDGSKFVLVFEDEGVNPLKHYDLVDFSYEITEILADHFKIKELLNRESVLLYLSYNSKAINRFNHRINELVTPYQEIPFIDDIKELRKRLSSAYKKKDKIRVQKLKDALKRADERQKKKIFFQEREEMTKKTIKKIKDMKIQHMIDNSKVKLENHADKEYFDDNFSGIKDLFINLFGN
jgi:hypothetical protein